LRRSFGSSSSERRGERRRVGEEGLGDALALSTLLLFVASLIHTASVNLVESMARCVDRDLGSAVEAASSRGMERSILFNIYLHPWTHSVSLWKRVLMNGVVVPLAEELCFFAVPALGSLVISPIVLPLMAGLWGVLHVFRSYYAIPSDRRRPIHFAALAAPWIGYGAVKALAWAGQLGVYTLYPFVPSAYPGIASLAIHIINNVAVEVKEHREERRAIEALYEAREGPYFGEPRYF